MANPFVGEIRILAGNFAPRGWAFCDGQLMRISQNTALFSLLGTTYGGDGRTTFALPDLQGRAPVHAGQGPGLTLRALGELGGETMSALLVSELPTHTHAANAVDAAGNQNSPIGHTWAQAKTGRRTVPMYADRSGTAPVMSAAAFVGSALNAHNNMPPYLCLTFIIALQGVFPARL